MNSERIEIYKDIAIVIISCPCTDGSVYHGYVLPDIRSVICYPSYHKALRRAETVIDNPNLVKSILPDTMFLPNPNWFK